MKYCYLIGILITCVPCTIYSQLSDHFWLTGYNEYPGVTGYGHAGIRFLPGGNTQVSTTPLAFDFESTVSVATDRQDNLLFYTNGCEIANRNHLVMPNGSGLNPGEISQQVCNWKGYVLPQGAMTLPAPGDSNHYYLLHTGATYDPVRKLRRGPLYYTLIDMTLENGLGDVVSKNNILIDADLGSFTVIRHGNGRDWWVIVPEFGNKIWHTFLLSPNGFEEQASQQVALMLPGCEHHEATVASLDGSRIANWGDCKVTVLNFDRCAGALDNLLELDAPSHWIPGGGVAFSPSGRYLYATSQNVLFRADLESAAPQLDSMRISYAPSSPSPYSAYDVPGNTFHYLANGPNGYIYGNIPSRARYLHVLKSPDAPSIAGLSFQPQGLSLPVTGVRTLPHFPNYRLLDLPDSPCDTLGINGSVSIKDPINRQAVKVFPNPAQANLSVELPFEDTGNWDIIDWQGKRVLQDQFMQTNTFSIYLRMLPAGAYALSIYTDKGMRYFQKFIITR